MPRHLKEYIYTQERVDRRKVSGHVFPYQLSIEPWDSENGCARKNKNQDLFILFTCPLV